MPVSKRSSVKRSVIRSNPVIAIANDGVTVLKRYRVDGVIYARNIKEARARLNEAVPMILDDAVVESPGTRRNAS